MRRDWRQRRQHPFCNGFCVACPMKTCQHFLFAFAPGLFCRLVNQQERADDCGLYIFSAYFGKKIKMCVGIEEYVPCFIDEFFSRLVHSQGPRSPSQLSTPGQTMDDVIIIGKCTATGQHHIYM